ncbi:hypothetical protein [Halobaculum roseum]|uniref:Glycerophosphoryl diester phosphodiesterase membrane domain-containing protein n=1 Tax=Halobaculum roseum TaxID=2175149 RepID=A0ABD5MNX3_9EURY|nr:hypothetical protein [Halobaculum roseum]QZY03611.1 hypothetical protein K6T36_05445 [Halobaculum roseum]
MSTTVSTDPVDRIERLGVRRLVTWAAVRVRENPVLVGLFLLAGLVGYVPFVGGLLAFLVTTFVLGMAYVVVADDVRLHARGLNAIAADVRERYGTILVVSVAYAVAVALGLIALVVPGLYIAARLAPSLPVATLGEHGAADSLREGWAMGRGNVLRLFGVFLVVFVLQAIAAGILAVISTDLATTGISAVLLNAISGPIIAAAIAHVYFESRDAEGDEPTDEMTADVAV